MSAEYNIWSAIQRSGALSGQVAQNTADIIVLQQQEGGVPQLTAQVITNTSNITVLQEDVDVLSGEVSQNTSNIISLTNGSDNLALQVAGLTQSVIDNTSSIGELQTDVATNTSNIGTLQTDVATNTSNISTLQTDVATNTSNIGTLQIDVATNTSNITALQNPLCGQWHKNNQTINSVGTPTFTTITWNHRSTWTDTSTISHNGGGNANFTVNVRGIYRINLQVLFNNLSMGVFADKSIRVVMNVLRGGNTNTISQTNFDFADAVPNTAGVTTGVLFELNVGDVISFQSIQSLSSGSFNIQGQTAPPNDWDLNTFWSWELFRLL
jgi:hypothetical protein